MFHSSYTGGGVGVTELSTPGAQMSGFLIPNNQLNDPKVIIRKKYLDDVFAGLSTDSITSGYLHPDTIKFNFTGDVKPGSGSQVLIDRTVNAGTYCKVTVDAKGLVTLGSTLYDTDIPDLNWSVITLDKPTTASGYGITDGLRTTGGTVTGNITLAAAPVNDLHACSKLYLEQNVQTLASNYIGVGDIVIRLTEPTPTGYLRCNGGYLSKTTYAALYANLGSSFNHPTDSAQFALPDLTTLELSGYGLFIKY